VEEDYSKKLKSFESLKFDNDLLARLDTDTHSFWFEGNNHLLKNDVSIDEKLLNNFLRGIISWCTQEPVNKWNEDGISHYRMQEYDDARKDFNKVIEVYPEFSAVWFNIGISFNEERQYQEAIKYYDKAIEIDPRYAVIWFKKGSSLRELARYEEAQVFVCLEY